MRIEETFRPQVFLLPPPPPKSSETPRNGEQQKRLVVVPPAVYVDYDKKGQATEHRFGRRSWVC